MTASSERPIDAPRKGFFGPLLRWTAAGAIVFGAHAGGVWIALHWKPAQAAPDGGAVMLIDLEPMPAAPEVETKDAAPGPEMTQAEAQPEAEPEPVPEPETEMPELPQQKSEDAVVAPPPKPPQEEPKPPEPKKRETKKPVEQKKKKVVQTTAPTGATSQAQQASAPVMGSNSGARADWRSQVLGILRRNVRSPPGINDVRVATVSFVLSRSGHVQSVRLVGSSGNGTLDQEAVALVHRSNPFIPAPPEVSGSAITFTVPIRFSRR